MNGNQERLESFGEEETRRSPDADQPSAKEDNVNVEIVWHNGKKCIVMPDGRLFPIVAGAQDDQPDNNDDTTQTEDDSDENDDESQSEEDIKDPSAKISALQDQVNRLSKKISKKDKEIETRDARIQEFEAKNKTDEDKVNERAQQAETKVSQLEERVTELEIESLILKHDRLKVLPGKLQEIVVSYVRPKLEIDDEDESNLDELIKDLEKDTPELFKASGTASTENGDDETRGKPSGRQPKSKSPGDHDRASLEKRFPALKRRMH